jgi:transcriptional regulator with XRE-family HTH domain
VKKTIHTTEYRRMCRMLKAQRVFLGLRQSDLADRLDVSQTFVSNYEKGERRLDLIELDAICEALQLRLVDFVTDFKKQNPA